MLYLLLAIVFSTLQSQVELHSESIKQNLKDDFYITDPSFLTLTNITDGSSIVLHINDYPSLRVFAFFYIPDQTISSFLIDDKPVQFKARDPNFEMFSIDMFYYKTIEFQFVSKPGGSSYGCAEFFIVLSSTCRSDSVGEFGSLNKQVNLSLPSNILSPGIGAGYFFICVFSPRFGLATGDEIFQVGSIYSSVSPGTLTYYTKIIQDNGEATVIGYNPKQLYRTDRSSYKYYHFQGLIGATVEGAQTILNRTVSCTSGESFYKNNCVAMNCQTCTQSSCSVSSSVTISYKCDKQPTSVPTLTVLPTNPDPDSGDTDKNNMGLIIGIVIAVVVVIGVIIVGIVCYRRRNKLVNKFDQHSNSQVNSKTPLGTSVPGEIEQRYFPNEAYITAHKQTQPPKAPFTYTDIASSIDNFDSTIPSTELQIK